MLCGLYIIPFLVEQKTEAGCFRSVPSFCAPISAVTVPPSYLPFSSPWPVIQLIHGILAVFFPILNPF